MTGDMAKEFEQLEVWKQFKAEIDKLIGFESRKLMTCQIDQVEAIRQKIMAYENVKSLPQNIAEREEE